MTRKLVETLCRPLPGAETGRTRAGRQAWSVGGRPFAVVVEEDWPGVCVRMPDAETAMAFMDMDVAEPAPGLPAGWALLPWARVPEHELRHRILASYRLVRAGLPKKAQAALGPAPAG